MTTNTNYLVQIIQYGSPGAGAPVTAVTAPIPETVSFDVSSTYDTLLPQSFTKNSVINTAAAAMGMRLAVQSLTAQLWTGSTTGDLNLQLEFYTENDPDTDVRTPILNLMKLVTPTVNAYGLMQSPGPQLDFTQLGAIAVDAGKSLFTSAAAVIKGAGSAAKNVATGAYSQATGQTPSVAQMGDGNTQTVNGVSSIVPSQVQQNPQLGTAAYWKNQVSNRIQIKIGNYMFFDNVVVTHVANQFTSSFDAITGLPHHVIVNVSFKPMFALSASDLDSIFISPGGSTSGNNSYGFSIPDGVANAGTNVTNQFGLSTTFGF